jgi:hypothetical protein
LHISQTLYMDIVSKVHLFKGCSEDFLSQIVRTSCKFFSHCAFFKYNIYAMSKLVINFRW